ncbi:MAG: PhoH family protein [Pseudomonadota bacterium]|nr:MAG: PhoH family protein [Pseudomonadota bacterium]
MSPRSTHNEFALTPADNRRLANLCGQHDEHLRQIEKYLDVEIASRGNQFRVSGKPQARRSAEQILKELYATTAGRENLTAAGVHSVLQLHALRPSDETLEPALAIRTPKRAVQPMGEHQRDYIRAILTHDINFGIGPAGTGKTYLAVACAVDALQSNRVQRIVLVRPVVEAGERLGFLPGAIEQKIDPYLRPLYDALHEMLGFEKVARLLESNVIELAPLAYMRGRTLNEAFIILDEAQNTTSEQMKMFLTRIGFGTTAVITGDVTQIDLKRGQVSGLKQVMEVLRNVEGITFTQFTPNDVVRHALVQRIVEAYEAHERAHPHPPEPR